MKKIITFTFLLTALMSWGWGQKGHDVTASVAERHLTPKAKAAVSDLLDGKSMIYWANWLDNASHTPQYAYTKTWHYKNINAGVPYEKMSLNPSGDVVTAINSQIAVLKDAGKSRDEKVLVLKILVHTVGDLHQPMHMGRQTDLGGNKVKVKYFNRDRNLHGIWDTDLVESAHKWSYTEWTDMIDRTTPAQQEEMVKGTTDDWARQTHEIAKQIYEEIPEGYNLSYNDVARWAPVIEQQLLTGGIRLASILNSIFQ